MGLMGSAAFYNDRDEISGSGVTTIVRGDNVSLSNSNTRKPQ
jgi:hypothetical protein